MPTATAFAAVYVLRSVVPVHQGSWRAVRVSPHGAGTGVAVGTVANKLSAVVNVGVLTPGRTYMFQLEVRQTKSCLPVFTWRHVGEQCFIIIRFMIR